MGFVAAWIFDLDGVLADTQRLHAQVEHEILSRYGCTLTEHELSRQYAGVSCNQIFRELIKKPGIDIDGLVEEKWHTVTRATRGNVVPIDGSIDLVRELAGAGLPLGVASGSRPKYINLVLTELGIAGCFSTVISSTHVARGKPAPDIFLYAASHLGVAPRQCVVVEDGIAGMIGAKAAYMSCIGLVSDVHASYPADRLVQSLREITPHDFRFYTKKK